MNSRAWASRDRFHLHAPEEQHADALAHVRRVLRVVAQDDRLQPEELLIRRVVVEVDAQSRLDAAAAARAARPDADVPDRLVGPLEIARVHRVIEIVDLQRLPVLRVDRQPDVVEDGVVEERIGRVRVDGRRLRPGRPWRGRQGSATRTRMRRNRSRSMACLPLPVRARTGDG